MKRRFMMWMTIICIFVVGISVTRMTRDFVASQGVDTAAIINVIDAGNMTVAATAAEAATVISDEETALPGTGQSDNETIVNEITMAAVQSAMDGSESDAALTGSDAVTDETAIAEAAAEETELETVPAEAPAAYKSGSPKAPLDTTKLKNIQETVKSPLDPVINKEVIIETEEETISYNAETFFERFTQTEKNALKVWENVSSDNSTAYLAAAEQERGLWDYELNQVYNMIRSKMTVEEAETLKMLELEWLKERDLYAEKAAAKSSMKNAYNQNPEYTKALAEKTKERCYWLVSEYEDILNRETTHR